MSSQFTSDTLIIGAGLAGLTAARDLRSAGREVIVLEKSRGLGGRAATRRWGTWPVDHGAQFFTARSEEFRAQVAAWVAAGVCFEWTRGFHQWRDGILAAPAEEAFPRYACQAGMAALGRALAGEESTFVRRETAATGLRWDQGCWIVEAGAEKTFLAKSVVLALPPAQATALLADLPDPAGAITAGLSLAPSLALVARYPAMDLAWQGVQVHGHPVLSWIGHDTSKRPGLHPGGTVLVFHALAEFSSHHQEGAAGDVAGEILAAAQAVTGAALAAPEDFFLQRWRYALAGAAPTSGAVIRKIDTPAPLVLAGDAVAGGKIEGAWLSGKAAARTLLEG